MKKKWYRLLVRFVFVGLVISLFSLYFEVAHLYDFFFDKNKNAATVEKIIVSKCTPVPRSILSSSQVNKALLQKKISKGLPRWAKDQIQSDLSSFKTIKRAALNEYIKDQKPGASGPGLMRFQIQDGKVITISPTGAVNQCEQTGDFLCVVMADVFQYLASNYDLPDTDFIVGLGDYIDSSSKEAIPLFTFAKDLNNPVEKDFILIPDWTNINTRTNFITRIRNANKVYPWEEKKSLLFWRGGLADSTGFRKALVELSDQYPKDINAKFVSGNTNFTSPEDHLKYKYLISIDGTRCAWGRLVWHLHSNSLTFKHQSNQVQWFYKGIKPDVHFVPIQNEQDLIAKLTWAKSHENKVKTIAKNAHVFVEDNLSLEDMYHYVLVLLQEYTKKLETIEPEMKVWLNDDKPTLVYSMPPKAWTGDTESITRLLIGAKDMGWNVISNTEAKKMPSEKLKKAFGIYLSDIKPFFFDHFPENLPLVEIRYIIEREGSEDLDGLVRTIKKNRAPDPRAIGILGSGFKPIDYKIPKQAALSNLKFVITWYPTTRAESYQPQSSLKKLMYCGGNFPGNTRMQSAKYLELWNKLDKNDYFAVYGPEHYWNGFKSYKGYIPADGKSFVKEINQNGICLILHNPETHTKHGVPTGRIFEAAAAAAVIISDKHPFIEKEFKDTVLYIDESREDLFEQIDAHMQWIKTHPKEAKEKALRAHAIFLEKFTLEKQLSTLYQCITESTSAPS